MSERPVLQSFWDMGYTVETGNGRIEHHTQLENALHALLDGAPIGVAALRLLRRIYRSEINFGIAREREGLVAWVGDPLNGPGERSGMLGSVEEVAAWLDGAAAAAFPDSDHARERRQFTV